MTPALLDEDREIVSLNTGYFADTFYIACFRQQNASACLAAETTIAFLRRSLDQKASSVDQ